MPPRLRRIPHNIDSGDANDTACWESSRGADADGCSLSGTIWTEQAEDLALTNLEVDAIQGHDPLLAFVDLD